MLAMHPAHFVVQDGLAAHGWCYLAHECQAPQQQTSACCGLHDTPGSAQHVALQHKTAVQGCTDVVPLLADERETKLQTQGQKSL